MGQSTKKINRAGRWVVKRERAIQLARSLSVTILAMTLLKACVELLSAILALFK